MTKTFAHHFPFPVITITNAAEVARFVKFRIRYAEATGYIHNAYFSIVQHFASSSICMELFETFSKRPYKHQIIVKEKGPVLAIALRGNIHVNSPQRQTTQQLKAGQCILGFVSAGSYRIQIPRSHTRLLLIACRTEWFKERTRHFPEIQLMQSRPGMRGIRLAGIGSCPLSFSMLRTIIRLLSLHPNAGRQKLSSETGQLITSLLEEYNKLCLNKKEHVYARINKISDYIGKILNEKKPVPSIADIASRFGFSERSLQYHVKQATGLTPSEFISDLKMQEALRLLKETGMQVQEAAHLLGYQTVAGFRKEFKKKYRQTPSQYQRKRYSNEQD